MKLARAFGIAIAAALIAGCGGQAGGAATEPPPTGDAAMTFNLTSPAWKAGQPIPRQYTCQGNDTSPALEWSDPPANTRSFALIMDDPDAPAGVWVHWVAYNLPAAARSLAAAAPAKAEWPDGTRQGNNSWPRLGYGGPCPPSGAHRYVFKLYALDRQLDLPPGATQEQLLKAMQGHILGQAELIGTYRKS